MTAGQDIPTMTTSGDAKSIRIFSETLGYLRIMSILASIQNQ